MAKFSSLVQGPRARKPVTMPLLGARFDAETGKWEGPHVELDLRPLRPDEHDKVLAEARKYAISLGVAEPAPGDDLFESGKMLHTLAIACVDRESPPHAPAPFFDGGVPGILEADSLIPEILCSLYDQQQAFQYEVNPLRKNMTPAEFTATVMRMAKDGDEEIGFFGCMVPGMLWSFTHSMAKLLAPSMMRASLSTSDSASPTTPPETSTETAPPPRPVA